MLAHFEDIAYRPERSGNAQALWSGVYATCVHWQDCLCAPASEDFVLWMVAKSLYSQTRSCSFGCKLVGPNRLADLGFEYPFCRVVLQLYNRCNCSVVAQHSS